MSIISNNLETLNAGLDLSSHGDSLLNIFLRIGGAEGGVIKKKKRPSVYVASLLYFPELEDTRRETHGQSVETVLFVIRAF